MYRRRYTNRYRPRMRRGYRQNRYSTRRRRGGYGTYARRRYVYFGRRW